jgi:hypothetical protein
MKQTALELGVEPSGLDPRPCRRQRYQTIIIAFFGALATVFFIFYSGSKRNAVALAPSLFRPNAYEVVPGFFAQSLNSTNDTLFDFVILVYIKLME